MIPPGLSCNSFSTIPLIGCCPPTPSTLWGIGLYAKRATAEAPPDFGYSYVTPELLADMRTALNNWPAPPDEIVADNSVSVFYWPIDLIPGTNDPETYTVCSPPVAFWTYFPPFDPPVDLTHRQYIPFSAIKHDYTDRETSLNDGSQFPRYYSASAIRQKVAINPTIPQIRKKTAFGRSFGLVCGARGHIGGYPTGFPYGSDNYVIEEDMVMNNPGVIDMPVPSTEGFQFSSVTYPHPSGHHPDPLLDSNIPAAWVRVTWLELP